MARPSDYFFDTPPLMDLSLEMTFGLLEFRFVLVVDPGMVLISEP